MASSLSNLVDNPAEGIHKISDYFLEYESIKDNPIKYKCLSCNKDSSKLDEELKKRFKNIIKNLMKHHYQRKKIPSKHGRL